MYMDRKAPWTGGMHISESVLILAINVFSSPDKHIHVDLRAISTQSQQLYFGHFLEATEPKYPAIFAMPVTVDTRKALLVCKLFDAIQFLKFLLRKTTNMELLRH